MPRWRDPISKRAGVTNRVEIIVGSARDTLEQMIADKVEPFDLFFIDADKQGMPTICVMRSNWRGRGPLIIIDNVVRNGAVIDQDSPDPMVQGSRRLYDALEATSQVSATAVQTVGLKGWDGFVLAIVNEGLMDGPTDLPEVFDRPRTGDCRLYLISPNAIAKHSPTASRRRSTEDRRRLPAAPQGYGR